MDAQPKALALGTIDCQMVDARQAAVLRAVVQQYIETSQPVSSSHVTRAGHIRASSATVRGDMALLEREGYLQQPHTSAGRIPTDRGYRYFVDHLNAPGHLQPAQQADVRAFFEKTSGEIAQMINETGDLLTRLTGSAAVVVASEHEVDTVVRSIQLVYLHSRFALAVVVFSNGVVEKRTVELDEGTTETTIAEASLLLARQLIGKSFSQLASLQLSNRQSVDDLATKTFKSFASKSEQSLADHVYVGGASRLAGAFDAIETVKNVLSILEQQYVVVTLIRDLLDRGMSVSIGAENNLQSLSKCSLVVAPTVVGGEHRGSIAILGPTRMDYSQALAAVAVVSRKLGERLAEGE